MKSKVLIARVTSVPAYYLDQWVLKRKLSVTETMERYQKYKRS